MSHFLTYIIAGMKKASFNAVNYDKILEITDCADANPVAFMSHLDEAVLKYTNLDPGSAEGSLPDIREELQNLEDLIEIAFWLFNNREEEKKIGQKRRDKEKEERQSARKRRGRKERT